jgi:transposase
MKRHELTDPQWEWLAPFFPGNGHRGGQWHDHRTIVNGILWRLNTGAPWRDLPERYGPWKTVYDRFTKLRHSGLLERLLTALQTELDARGLIDFDLWCVDGSSTRASRAAAGASSNKKVPEEPADHALGRSRGGFGTKIHLVTDGNGLPLAAKVSAGQRHECLYAEPVLAAVRIRRRNGRVRTKPKAVAGDKGYSYARVRRYLRRRKIKDIIPTRKDQRRRPGFDKDTYRQRNVVERCIGWLKESRALATRFDKLAVNYLATVQLAILRRYLRILTTDDSSDRP